MRKTSGLARPDEGRYRPEIYIEQGARLCKMIKMIIKKLTRKLNDRLGEINVRNIVLIFKNTHFSIMDGSLLVYCATHTHTHT